MKDKLDNTIKIVKEVLDRYKYNENDVCERITKLKENRQEENKN